MKIAMLTIVLALYVPIASADLIDELSELEGYVILGAETVSGWRDDDGEGEDDFQGCEHGRVILFASGRALTCNTYHYTYSFMPKAVLVAREVTYQGKDLLLFKMIVGDHVYDMIGR